MFEEFATDIATQMGIQLSEISVIDGERIGCLDVYLVRLATLNHKSSTLMYQRELDDLANGKPSDGLETKIRSALLRIR